MFDISQMGFFQLDNLIKNRVPFLMFMIEVDLRPHYNALDRVHLNTWSQTIEVQSNTLDQVKLSITERRWPQNMPIILICKSGDYSATVKKEIEAMGFQNVFHINGGYDQFIQEQAQE